MNALVFYQLPTTFKTRIAQHKNKEFNQNQHPCPRNDFNLLNQQLRDVNQNNIKAKRYLNANPNQQTKFVKDYLSPYFHFSIYSFFINQNNRLSHKMSNKKYYKYRRLGPFLEHKNQQKDIRKSKKQKMNQQCQQSQINYDCLLYQKNDKNFINSLNLSSVRNPNQENQQKCVFISIKLALQIIDYIIIRQIALIDGWYAAISHSEYMDTASWKSNCKQQNQNISSIFFWVNKSEISKNLKLLFYLQETKKNYYD